MKDLFNRTDPERLVVAFVAVSVGVAFDGVPLLVDDIRGRRGMCFVCASHY